MFFALGSPPGFRKGTLALRAARGGACRDRLVWERRAARNRSWARCLHVPLLVPLTLLNHYVRKFEEPYLKVQYYLNPHPLELQLRTHV